MQIHDAKLIKIKMSTNDIQKLEQAIRSVKVAAVKAVQ